MVNCVNKSTKEFKELALEVGIDENVLAAKVGVWQNKNGLDKFPVKGDIIPDSSVNYTLKSVSILSTPKAEQVFQKGAKAGWDLNKILTELQVPKEQKQIILDKYKDKVSEQEFIKSIFPDTKVNQIVYHGSKYKFNKFNTEISEKRYKNNIGIYFGDSNSYYDYGEKGYVYPSIVNVKNPYYIHLNEPGLSSLDTSKSLEENYKVTNKDGFIQVGHSNMANKLTREQFESLEEKKYFELEKELKKINISIEDLTTASKKKFNNIISKIPLSILGITELAINNTEQIHILTEEEQAKIYNQDNLREDIITSLLADNSYTVEATTSLSKAVEMQRASSERIEKATKEFQSNLSSMDTYVKQLANNSTDSIATTEDKIELMQKALDAVVIVDTSLEVSGQLLGANHPLTKMHGKPVIRINPELLFSDTVFHEFGHLYIDLLGGMSDSVVQDAIISLQGSDLWKTVESEYPELNQQDLAKEVLATALGLEADNVWKNDTVKRNIWNTIKDAIVNAIRDLLGRVPGHVVSNNAIEQLAREMLSNKLRITPEAKYNTLIDQNSSLRLDKPTQANIDKLFKDLTANYTLIEEEAARFYRDKAGNAHHNSVSKTAANMTPAFVQRFKGSYSIDLDQGWELTPSNLETILGTSTIPIALDQALNAYVHQELQDVSPTFSAKENERWDTFIDQLDSNDLSPISRKEFLDELKSNIKGINEAAKSFQKDKELPLVAGNIVHKALEEYIENRNEFPKNVQDEQSELFNAIKKIITEGEANGSKFYSEQMLFSQSAQIPGTADLIEITKDGKFKIYDFKTYNSFTKRGRDMTNWEMYISKGYLNQIMIYSAILQEYNIQPAEDYLNIIAIEVDKNNLKEEGVLRVKEVKVQNFSNKDRAFAAYIREANNKILPLFTNPNRLKDFNFKGKEETLKTLADKIHRDIKAYNKLTDYRTGKFLTSPLEENILMKRIEKNIEEMTTENNEAVVMSYIDNMRAALYSAYTNSKARGQDINNEYLANIQFLLQTAELIPDIITFLEEQHNDYHIEASSKDSLIDLLNEMSIEAETLRKYSATKTKQLAVHTLAGNSNFMKGLWKEKFELQAKADNKKGEEAVAWIEKQLVEKDDLIVQAEYNYWTDMFNNGYTDIRYMEYMLADPGMNKSQFVQLTKNIMDKADMAVRKELDYEMADMINWYDKLKVKKTGDPKKIWGKFITNAKYKDLDGNVVNFKHASIIPEKTSQYRETYLRYQYKEEFLEAEINKAKRANNKAKYEKLLLEVADVRDRKKEELLITSTTLYDHPDYVKLDSYEKSLLKELHSHLERADERLDLVPYKRLVKSIGKNDEYARIYNLPRVRKSIHEAAHDGSSLIQRMTSGLKDFVRPPADEDDMNMGNDGGRDDFEERTTSTDIVGNPSYEVPVYYRGILDNHEEQSFDIPTLLAMNHETTIVYQNYKMIEADLYMITNSLKDTKAFKTDSILNKKLVNSATGTINKEIVSPNNLVLKSVEASIRNRFYKRTYEGVYSGLNYKAIKSAEALNKLTGMILLAGNFGSASMTSLQGSIYRLIESAAGEDFGIKNSVRGSKKTWADVPNLISDSQKQFPGSKTELLIRRFGLETQYKALANKFVQSNFITKNLDEASMFALTSISEKIVTSSLMYTLMDNIKVMNKEGDYINKEGKKVPKAEAMSLDEAYDVIDNKLVLNPNVAFTERNLTTKFNDDITGDVTVASTEISSYIRSKYADLYGQYNQDMKSVAEMNIAGKLAFSMRKWIPRGYHNRWRGITTAGTYTFEQLREDENIEKRFYSQDQQKFQEGYYSTGVRFAATLLKEFKDKSISFAAVSKVKSTMTKHELANLTRMATELAVLATSFAASLLLRAIALGMDDDDKHKDKIYFAAYLAQRVHDESSTFMNPWALADVVQNPAAAVSTFVRMGELMDNLFWFTYDTEEERYDFNFNNTYEKGDRKGQLKLRRNFENLLPFVKKFKQMQGIFGYETTESIEDSYKFLIR